MPPSSGDNSARTRGKILVVEDDELTRLTLVAFLENSGHIALCAETVAGAEGLLARENPDVVLLDLSLPDECGLKFLERIRSAGVGVCVIIISSFNDINAYKKALYLNEGEGDVLKTIAKEEAHLNIIEWPTNVGHLRAVLHNRIGWTMSTPHQIPAGPN